MPVTLDCEVNGCTVSKTADTLAMALELLKFHDTQVHVRSVGDKQKPPKLDRPKVARGISAEEFATWSKRYELWKKSMVIAPSESAGQLLNCCEDSLQDQLISYHSDISDINERTMLERIRELAVLDVATTVRVNELLNTKQGHGEGARAFCARLRGKAVTCEFEVTCSKDGCDQKTSYADNMVRHQLLNGLSSVEIQRDVLGTTNIDTKTLVETLGIIEARERAFRATTAHGDSISSVSSISAYKKDKRFAGSSLANANCNSSDMHSCKKCSKSTPKFGKNRYGQVRELKFCAECFRASTKKPKARQTGN